MHKFRDTNGREWKIILHVTAVKDVKDRLKVDLLQADQDNTLSQLATDPAMLVDVLYVLCEQQAEQAGITDRQFGEGLAGDAIDRATTAFLEELIDFFPKSRRIVLKKVLAKMNEVIDRAVDVATKTIDSPAAEQMIERNLKTIGDSFGSLPASSGSTPQG